MKRFLFLFGVLFFCNTMVFSQDVLEMKKRLPKDGKLEDIVNDWGALNVNNWSNIQNKKDITSKFQGIDRGYLTSGDIRTEHLKRMLEEKLTVEKTDTKNIDELGKKLADIMLDTSGFRVGGTALTNMNDIKNGIRTSARIRGYYDKSPYFFAAGLNGGFVNQSKDKEVVAGNLLMPEASIFALTLNLDYLLKHSKKNNYIIGLYARGNFSAKSLFPSDSLVDDTKRTDANLINMACGVEYIPYKSFPFSAYIGPSVLWVISKRNTFDSYFERDNKKYLFVNLDVGLKFKIKSLYANLLLVFIGDDFKKLTGTKDAAIPFLQVGVNANSVFWE